RAGTARLFARARSHPDLKASSISLASRYAPLGDGTAGIIDWFHQAGTGKFLESGFEAIQLSFRDDPKDQTSDVQLHVGESRDSGFDAEPVTGPRFARTRWHRPGMTASIGVSINPASHSLWQCWRRRQIPCRRIPVPAAS